MADEKMIMHDDDIVREEDGLVFNPYNPSNIEIRLNDVQSILKEYDVPPLVVNMELYKRAFIHRSYTKRPSFENVQQNITIVPKPDDCMPLKTKSNERLEFLGDGLLELVTKFYLYRRFPKENEGFMTEKKIAIVKNEAIGRIAYEMGLHKWLVLSKHAEEKKIRTNLKKLGCLFESFLGALFLDYNKRVVKDEDGWFHEMFVTGPGFQMVQKFIETIFERHINWIELIQNDDNYKNILQVKIQKEFKVTPHYLTMENNPETGYRMGVFLCLGQSIHDMDWKTALAFSVDFQTFDAIHVYAEENDGKVFVFMGEGTHKIKRKAEQEACACAIQDIENFTKV